jgi:glycosyltransferase involved in cell wall biosynthesis
MAAGLPVVGNRISGVIDVINHAETGLIAEPNNPRDLALHLKSLLIDADLRCRLAAAGRQLVSDRFGFERVVDQLSDLYERTAMNN